MNLFAIDKWAVVIYLAVVICKSAKHKTTKKSHTNYIHVWREKKKISWFDNDVIFPVENCL